MATRTQHASTRASSLRLREVMTSDPRYVTPDCMLQEAARLMDELNVGTLLVCVDGHLLGMDTGREAKTGDTPAKVSNPFESDC